MDCMYKGVGGRTGRGGAGGKPEVGYTFQLDCGVAMSPRSVSHRPRQDCMHGGP